APRHRGLLRARSERPRSRAADHTDERALLYGRPVHPGLRPIRLSIQAIKTGKEVGRNGEAVRQMCTAEILSHLCRRWVKTGSALVEHKISASPPEPDTYAHNPVQGAPWYSRNQRRVRRRRFARTFR